MNFDKARRSQSQSKVIVWLLNLCFKFYFDKLLKKSDESRREKSKTRQVEDEATILFLKMSAPSEGGTRTSVTVKKKKRPRTRIERLKLKEVNLRRDLKSTLNEIKEDTQKRGNQESLGTIERQKLANRSTIIRSKLLRLQDEIETRNYVKDDKESKHIRSKIEDRYAFAARKHNRLLRMTAELERLKQDEEAVRVIANDELGLERRELNRAKSVNASLVDQRKLAGRTRISTTSFRHSTKKLDDAAEEREERLEDVRDSLSKLGIETPRQKIEKADGLEHKYDMTREIRNLAHGQMISRLHKNSYWRINPPYRRKRKTVAHVRRAYARDFYEDKVDIKKARNANVVSPRKEVLEQMKKEGDELTRFKMLSGRTISVKKMKDFTPPGMTLTTVE